MPVVRGCVGDHQVERAEFEYKGPFCGMAAFKKHVMFGFWKHQLMTDLIPKGEHRAFGDYRAIESIDDVPSRRRSSKLVKVAKKLNDDDVKVPKAARPKKPPVEEHGVLDGGVEEEREGEDATYEGFSPSHKREYVEWLTDAKTTETRDRRLAQAIEWMRPGKARQLEVST